jgi:hypothetical protein
MWAWAPLPMDHEEGGGTKNQRVPVRVGGEKYGGSQS